MYLPIIKMSIVYYQIGRTLFLYGYNIKIDSRYYLNVKDGYLRNRFFSPDYSLFTACNKLLIPTDKIIAMCMIVPNSIDYIKYLV